MNEWQNFVVATGVAGLILVIVFLCPWRIELTDEIRWSPIYQPPMAFVRTYDDTYGAQGGYKIESEEAHIAVDYLFLEVVAWIAVESILYIYFSDPKDDEKHNSSEAHN